MSLAPSQPTVIESSKREFDNIRSKVKQVYEQKQFGEWIDT